MSIPKDQGLALTIFLSITLFMVLLFWISLPLHFSKHNENDEEEVIEVLEPAKAVPTAKGILVEVEKAVTQLEEEAEKEDGNGEKKENPKKAGKK